MGLCRLQEHPFPGTPDPARICLKGGFDKALAYTLSYQARDPLVLGWALRPRAIWCPSCAMRRRTITAHPILWRGKCAGAW
jgi:hypothetical protein